MNGWEGELVRLRAIEPRDVDAIGADSDTDTARAGWRVFPPRSAWATGEWVRKTTEQSSDGDDFRVAIEALASGELVGNLNTYGCRPVDGTCSYGITLFSWAQRQGYGREAVVLVLRYLFGERRYQKCTVGAYGFNDGSVAFHEALGFKIEGRIRRAHFALGTYHDEIVLGITTEEFEKLWGFGGPIG